MTTANRTWTFPKNTQSWTATLGTSTTGAWQSADTSVADGSGCLEFVFTGSNSSASSYWEITDTWENLFGIPTNSTVATIGTPDDYDWKCSTSVRPSTSTTGPFEFRDSGGTLQATLSTGVTFNTTTAFATKTGTAAAVPATLNSSSTTIKLRLNATLATVAGGGPNITLRHDQISVTITYATLVYRQMMIAGKPMQAYGRSKFVTIPF
jgi:hypothetical protein